MTNKGKQVSALITAYAEEAEATGWFGPEVVFGLSYAYIQTGQSILDVGIGTGLGSDLFRKAGLKVYGMDHSPQMIEACRGKGITALQLHDLSKQPYPYDSESYDHAVCTGVMNFFRDLSPIFIETTRIIQTGGFFGFVVGDRGAHDPCEIIVGEEHTHSSEPVAMYLHSPAEIDRWMSDSGLVLFRSLAFTIYLDRKQTRNMQAKAYLAKKN
jgi:predicted TPR repeat methyltransferase